VGRSARPFRSVVERRPAPEPEGDQQPDDHQPEQKRAKGVDNQTPLPGERVSGLMRDPTHVRKIDDTMGLTTMEGRADPLAHYAPNPQSASPVWTPAKTKMGLHEW
jgi:hypothetical protein